MARRRHFHPDQDLVHVSFKCVGDAFLMRPDAYANYVVAVALEEAAEKYGVRIHAFCFLSNHAHLLLGIAGCRFDSFMQYVKSLIALALNAHHVLGRPAAGERSSPWSSEDGGAERRRTSGGVGAHGPPA